ncbi:hypothetical protein IGI04_025884 [Brassica rapa subsp. trilocularis]|uniref:Uncharacterized protein n=1 Tax=Brassica rapa subsp. trilocularis TaxID=1813537 RepID=A0ABQ7KVN9_BRACM|nr:hypothetical protein IGI04_025884 [Brassica rapa subsp. trilocularis]
MPLFFFFKNGLFTLSTSSSSSIYKIVIAINTPTTMNNQFEALNVPQIDLHFFFLNSYELKTTFLSLYLHIHPKNPKILILKFLWFIEPLKLTILGRSLLFEILGAWRRHMCAKQVISLVETMKSIFFSRSVLPDDFWVNLLVLDDLHGSFLVNTDAKTTYMEVVHLCLLKQKFETKSSWKSSITLPISLPTSVPDLKNMYLKPRSEKHAYQKTFKWFKNRENEFVIKEKHVRRLRQKSSGRLPGSLLAHYVLEDFERLMGSLLGSLLKNNTLEDFS